ncbi:sensor domain-containing diguanylate cyclase [Halalkalibacter urbisdiaboli]|uniref:sensor domain-containing diguanylate cyclase n=1 Tax=Halalkalibacter urbisdiaboli TaxID=1960589 RepID=UPI0013FDE03A|nr:diguanylate cyclase [Halalkalibacter urbisdiaboli]
MTNLRTKLPLFIVILVTCSILITGLLTYSFSSDLLMRKSEDEIKANAFRTGEAIHALVTSEIRKTEILASQPLFHNTLIVRNSLTDNEYFSTNNKHFKMTTEALRDAFQGSVNHEKFWLGDSNGVVIASSEEKFETGSINVVDRTYFLAAMKGHSAVSGTITSRANGETIIVTAAPVRNNTGQVIGVMGNSIYTSFFSDPLKGISVNERGNLYIIDSEGLILAHSKDESLIKTKVENPQILSLLDGKASDTIVKGTLETDEGGNHKYLSYSKIPLADWIVIVEDDIEDIKSPLKELAIKFFIVLLATLIVSLVFVIIFLSKWVTGPLQVILSTIKKVGTGDLEARMNIHSKDELGVLARTFNQMLVRIDKLMQAQEKANKLEVDNATERERSYMSEMLRSAMYTLSSSLDVDEVQQIALEELKAFVDYNRASIWSIHNQDLVMKVLAEEDNHQLAQLDIERLREYYEQFKRDEQPICSQSGEQSFILVIPYKLHGNLIGINVIERENKRFERSEADIILSYSSQVVVAISNAMLYHQMEKMAVTDELTGLYNRRYFYQLAQKEFKSAEINEEPLSVILFDIDHFKQINDIYGHFIGDEVLRQIASVISSTTPEKNVLARYGGEEFALVLPGLDGKAAEQFGEKMRQNVFNHIFITKKGPINVSISIGVTQLESGDHLETLLHRTDEALYQAKEQGRNCVILK